MRVQLALNVSDLDKAVEFYSTLFDAEPAKRRPGYANFAIVDPPLKLVLIEDVHARGSGIGGAVNHLGVEVGTPDEVIAASSRLRDAGLATKVEDDTTCCYALQDKVWVEDPDGNAWEVFVVKGEAAVMERLPTAGGCCVPKIKDEGSPEEQTTTSAKAGGGCCG